MLNLTINARNGLLLLASDNNLKTYIRAASDTRITFNCEAHTYAIESYCSDIKRLFNVDTSTEYCAYSIVVSIVSK